MKKNVIFTLLIIGLAALVQPICATRNSKDIRERLKWINLESLDLAIKDMKEKKGFNYSAAETNLSFIKKNLLSVQERINGTDSIQALSEATVLLNKQRDILISNPLFDMDKIVTTRFTLGKQARTATTNKMCMPMSNYMGLIDVPSTGYEAEICELNNLRNPSVSRRTIYKPKKGEGIADVQLHWDADRMLFASASPVVIDAFYNQEYPAWRIFEIGLDGENLKLISDLPEPDLEYADPCYLPDGRILFTNNIGYNGIPCEHGERVIMNLAIYDPKDKSMRKITFDQDGNWSPTVLNNGRIMYTRWEYTDLTHYFSRIIMHSNPDGTECKSLYGSGSYWPTSVYDMQQLPNAGSRFVGIVSGHHGIPRSGHLIMFDPAKGRKETTGVVQEIPFRNREVKPIIKDQLVDGVWPQFSRPYPLDKNYILVTAKLHEDGLWGIYLVDVFDNLTLIVESEGDGYLTPIPVVKRVIPPVIPDRIVEGEKEATVFIQDIYTGEGLRKVPRGTVKKLRLLTYEYAYLKSPSDFDALGVQSGWDLKRELGTVDVEEDGSVIFKVPANTPISMQPLDEDGNAIQWMRSWFTAMPGEVVSCIGCHEDQNTVVIPKRVIASQKKPSIIKAPVDGVHPISFEFDVQPILDKYCITCHDGTNNEMNLTGKEEEEYVRWGNYTTHRYMKKSYLKLHPYVYRQGPEADMYVLQPYEYHASNSELIQMIDKGHHNVALDKTDYQKLCQWIDFNAPYFGTFEIAGRYKGVFPQYERRQALMQKYANISVNWEKELTEYSNILKNKEAVELIKPKAVTAEKINWKQVNKWTFDATKAKELQKNSAEQIEKEIEIAAGISMRLVWIPKGKYTKGTDQGGKYPTDFKDVSINDGFWMGALEVTNAQYTAVVKEHDSRFIGQQWKDHTTPGYPANEPNQPVIRVTWEESMAYCRELSIMSGMQITLPTEAEWEWACRAGNGEDMWYGSRVENYSNYENLADFTIKDLAVWGMEPTVPMPDNAHDVRKFWDYVPRDKESNDKNLISVKGGQYQANPWGLYDMQGNVAEWTNSECDTNERYMGDKVVCGGSWRDRAAKSTISSRRYFKKWQAPFNVGFRVIAK